MITIKDIPYEQQFYWKGVRYKQIIRPKNPEGKFHIYAYDVSSGNSEWLKMPSGRKIKPVTRCSSEIS
jgi:hypothetical protein